MTSTRAATIARLVIPKPINSARELHPNVLVNQFLCHKNVKPIPRKNYHLATDNAEPDHATAQHVGFEHIFSSLRELQNNFILI